MKHNNENRLISEMSVGDLLRESSESKDGLRLQYSLLITPDIIKFFFHFFPMKMFTDYTTRIHIGYYSVTGISYCPTCKLHNSFRIKKKLYNLKGRYRVEIVVEV